MVSIILQTALATVTHVAKGLAKTNNNNYNNKRVNAGYVSNKKKLLTN